jgi:hypothetical protein
LLDGKTPLLLHFKDNNKANFKPGNVSLLCYNCYFIKGFDIFSKKTLKNLEDASVENIKMEELPEKTPEFEIDEYQIEHLKNLGLWDGPDDDIDIISKM